MRKILLTLFVLSTIIAKSQVDSVYHRIILIGDAGELHQGKHPVIDWVKANMDMNDNRNIVIYLGDNIYPLGLPSEGESSYKISKEILDYQINLVKGKKAKAYFINGNHDWKNGKIGGWEQAMNQTNYINSLGESNIESLPTEGCPGPIEVEVSEQLVIVLLDSQWWLHLHDKPGVESYCEYKTEDEIVTAIKEISDVHPNQLLVVAMHHPMYSYGVHGGLYTWRHHIFPLTEIFPAAYVPMPVLGSIYPVARGIFGNIQDVKHPLYKTMVSQIEEVLKSHPNPIHVSGHDHGLQLLIKDSIPYIVSGSGVNLSRVKTGKYTEYAEANYGFSTIEIYKSGKVETKFFTIASRNADDPKFVKNMKPVLPPEKKTLAEMVIPDFPDSMTVVANVDLKASGFHKILFGENYRKEWTTPVTVPVLDIGKERGGLVPTKRGGGKQTKSFRLEDKNEREYALRLIQKFPDAAIPADLRKTIAKDIVEDGVSASYPYGSLSYAPFARALGIPVIDRKLVYIPDDPRLNRFRNDFANTLAILEEREPPGTTKTYNSDELVLRLQKDHDDHVDQKKVLRARLLDNFLMDFDRHEDQWRWATYDTGKGKIYYPIPRDHDQVFFVNQGVVPKMVRQPWYIPQLQGFDEKAHDINTFNFAARNFDRAFMNELAEDNWIAEIDTFLRRVDDNVIEEALNMQPKEIRDLSKDEIVKTLKERRNYFREEMMDYYRFLNKIVNVVATNQKELITVTRGDNGDVHVAIENVTKEGDTAAVIYNRMFYPATTKEIRLYGLGGDDKFVFKGSSDRKIQVRIIGGPGEDEFNNETTGNAGKTKVYDVSFEKNKFTGNEVWNRINENPVNNRYTRLYYKYNIPHPGLSFGYNPDDGLYLGFRFQYTGHGFRKEPYATKHDLRLLYALATSATVLTYDAEFNHLFAQTDLVIDADVMAPNTTTNFFGIGNDTPFDETKPGGVRFYRSRYNLGDLAVQLRHRLQSWMDVLYGPSIQLYSIGKKFNKNRVLERPGLVGLDSASVYDFKAYAGLQLAMLIDSRNHNMMPTRGLVVNAEARPLIGITKNAHNIVQVKWDMSLFISLVQETRAVFATRFGVGHNFGSYEYFQSQYLSGTDNLRGYRRNRFAGKTMMFSNNDLRFRLANFNTYLFPGSIGILGFFDVGRVWADVENSEDWHVGYGGGLWISPLKRFVITLSVARSKDEILPVISYGFQF